MRRALSSHALAALHDFYVERDEKERRFEELKAGVEASSFHSPLSMEMFSEDWNASQFWVHGQVLLRREHSNGFSTAMKLPSCWPKSFFKTQPPTLGLPSCLRRACLFS